MSLSYEFEGAGRGITRPNFTTITFSPENPTGEARKGCLAIPAPNSPASDLGPGWKARPCIQFPPEEGAEADFSNRTKLDVPPGSTVTLAEYEGGQGFVQRIWCTYSNFQHMSKLAIIEGYFDGSPVPSFRCPIGAFFGTPWGYFGRVRSEFNTISPQLALECSHKMPFEKSFKLTLTNIGVNKETLFYSVDAGLYKKPVPKELYFNGQFFISNPAEKGVHPVLDVHDQGAGFWSGVLCGWKPTTDGWWGEGVWMGTPDHGLPPIVLPDDYATFKAMEDERLLQIIKGGTTNNNAGTEDFFGASWDFLNDAKAAVGLKQYRSFSNPCSGFVKFEKPEHDEERSMQAFGMYRWLNPVIDFNESMSVGCHVLGWHGSKPRFAKRKDVVTTFATYYSEELPKEQLPFPSFEELSLL